MPKEIRIKLEAIATMYGAPADADLYAEVEFDADGVARLVMRWNDNA